MLSSGSAGKGAALSSCSDRVQPTPLPPLLLESSLRWASLRMASVICFFCAVAIVHTYRRRSSSSQKAVIQVDEHHQTTRSPVAGRGTGERDRGTGDGRE